MLLTLENNKIAAFCLAIFLYLGVKFLHHAKESRLGGFVQ